MKEGEPTARRLLGSDRSMQCSLLCHLRRAIHPRVPQEWLLFTQLQHMVCLSCTFVLLVCLLFVWMWSGTRGWNSKAARSCSSAHPSSTLRTGSFWKGLCQFACAPTVPLVWNNSAAKLTELRGARLPAQHFRKSCRIGSICMFGCYKEKQMRRDTNLLTVSEVWPRTLKRNRNCDAVCIPLLLYGFLMFFSSLYLVITNTTTSSINCIRIILSGHNSAVYTVPGKHGLS